MACYGRPDLHTPNIDALAARGTRFLQAYANSAVCSATRTALITGRYQYWLAIGLEEPLSSRPARLPPEQPTLPSLLNNAGYGTTLVGKWHLGKLPKYGPLQSGYDDFYGFRGSAVDYYTQSNDLWDGDLKIEQAGYMTDLLGGHAVDVIQGYADSRQPFLLSLHFNAPIGHGNRRVTFRVKAPCAGTPQRHRRFRRRFAKDPLAWSNRLLAAGAGNGKDFSYFYGSYDDRQSTNYIGTV